MTTERCETAHSPTPWHVDADTPSRIYGSDGYVVARTHFGGACPALNAANAAFIVQAVNAHDDLLAACEAACADLPTATEADDRERILTTLRAAIAKATKEGTPDES